MLIKYGESDEPVNIEGIDEIQVSLINDELDYLNSVFDYAYVREYKNHHVGLIVEGEVQIESELVSFLTKLLIFVNGVRVAFEKCKNSDTNL